MMKVFYHLLGGNRKNIQLLLTEQIYLKIFLETYKAFLILNLYLLFRICSEFFLEKILIIQARF